MTNEDFSNRFDVMLNTYLQEQYGKGTMINNITFNEYEKSLLLTEAQEQFVLSCYNGKNQFGDAFETSEEMRRYLDVLIKTVTISPISDNQILNTLKKVDDRSLFYTLPSDLIFITMEQLKIQYNKNCCPGKDLILRINIYPVRHDEYNVIRDNPFRGVNRRRALRIDYGTTTRYVEIIIADKYLEDCHD